MRKGVVSPCSWWTGVFQQIMKLWRKCHLLIRHHSSWLPSKYVAQDQSLGRECHLHNPITCSGCWKSQCARYAKKQLSPLMPIRNNCCVFFLSVRRVLSSLSFQVVTEEMSCLCEAKQHFLCPGRLSSGTWAVFLPAEILLKLYFLLV